MLSVSKSLQVSHDIEPPVLQVSSIAIDTLMGRAGVLSSLASIPPLRWICEYTVEPHVTVIFFNIESRMLRSE